MRCALFALRSLMVAGSFGAAVSAQASITTLVFTGLVTSGCDVTGVYAAPGGSRCLWVDGVTSYGVADLTGAHFTYTVRIDDSNPALALFGPGYGSEAHGGSQGGNPAYVTGTLAIEGVASATTGAYSGDAYVYSNTVRADRPDIGDLIDVSTFLLDDPRSAVGWYSYSWLHVDGPQGSIGNSWDFRQPGSYDLSGVHGTGRSIVSHQSSGAFGPDVFASVDLQPLHLTILGDAASVPEPATPALLGLALWGAITARPRRARATSAP